MHTRIESIKHMGLVNFGDSSDLCVYFVTDVVSADASVGSIKDRRLFLEKVVRTSLAISLAAE